MYHYVCSNGHTIEHNHALAACPVCVKGHPCDGELRRVGPGSRKRTENP